MATYASGEQTRDLIIAAAGELAALNGFSNVSIRAVAKRAGRNIGSIHYHFKSKLELFKSVIHSATKSNRDFPPQTVLDGFDGQLHLPEVQAAAVQSLVHRTISVMLDPQKAWWHSRVIYQTMQGKDELWEILHREVIEPEVETARKLFKQIKPDLSDDEAFIHTMLIKSPLIHHADNAATILTFLKKDAFPSGYFQKMEDLIVRQTLLLMGLPTDKNSLIKG